MRGLAHACGSNMVFYMARQKVTADFRLIEKIFDQLSSSVAIALLKDDKLAYEFYGGRKAAISENGDKNAKISGKKFGLGGKSGKSSGNQGKAANNLNRARNAPDDAKEKGGNGAGLPETGINRSTRFNLGSASSLFTGALVVKLMEFGELSLSDPVRRFLPEFPFDGIMVYDLMTHTSGLDSAALPLPDNHAAKREYFRKLYEGLKQIAKPGEKFEYFQYNYAILADLVEKLSGQMLDELASVLIFMPLGMKHTTYNGASLRDSQYVVPWNHKENRFMSELHTKQPTGNNAVYTTALDLLRFGRMLLNEGEFDGKPVFLESSVEFMFREITGGKFKRTPIFMVKSVIDVFGCFSEKMSPESIALTGDMGSLLFVDPIQRIVGAALTNSTWVHAGNQNYSNIADILTSL